MKFNSVQWMPIFLIWTHSVNLITQQTSCAITAANGVHILFRYSDIYIVKSLFSKKIANFLVSLAVFVVRANAKIVPTSQRYCTTFELVLY